MKLHTINISSPIEKTSVIVLTIFLSVCQTMKVKILCSPIATNSTKSKTGPQIQLLLFWSSEYVVTVSTTRQTVKKETIHSFSRLCLLEVIAVAKYFLSY